MEARRAHPPVKLWPALDVFRAVITVKKSFRQIVALFVSLLLLVFEGISREGPKPEEVIIVSPEKSPMTIEVWVDKTRYSPGESLKLHFSLNRDAYVYIYDIDTQGEVRLIFPNAFVKDSFVKAGKHTLPDKRYSFVVSGPEGVEFVQAIATTESLPILSLAPQASFEKEVFPLLGVNPKKHKLSMELLLKELPKEGWVASWTYFLISQRSATLAIITQPTGAKIYLDERFVGETPRELEVEPGRIRIKLIKTGYEPWADIIYLEDKALAELKIQLSPQRVPERPTLPPPDERIRFDGPSPFSSIGLNAGANRDNIFSLGFELGLFKRLSIGAAFLFTGEPVPDYFDVGEPVDLENEQIFSYGPETEFYLKLSLPIAEALLLEGSLGIATQQIVNVAMPREALQPNPEAIEIKPNGYKDIKAYFTGLVGIAVRLDALKISVGYHTRRGWTIGVGVEF